MEKKLIKQLYLLFLGILILSCSTHKCINLNSPLKKEILLSKKLNKFICDHSKNEIYLINPINNEIISDVKNLYYYYNIDSTHILIFNSSIFMDKFLIVIIQNEIIKEYPCANVFQICEYKQSDKHSIEIQDSILEFNSLSFGIHKIDVFLKNDSVSYNYMDTLLFH